jgi:drug/metabolite transporter (DMT)-like permease
MIALGSRMFLGSFLTVLANIFLMEALAGGVAGAVSSVIGFQSIILLFLHWIINSREPSSTQLIGITASIIGVTLVAGGKAFFNFMMKNMKNGREAEVIFEDETKDLKRRLKDPLLNRK